MAEPSAAENAEENSNTAGPSIELSFVKAASAYVVLKSQEAQVRRQVIGLARRLVVDPAMSDDEAITRAGEIAKQALGIAAPAPEGVKT